MWSSCSDGGEFLRRRPRERGDPYRVISEMGGPLVTTFLVKRRPVVIGPRVRGDDNGDWRYGVRKNTDSVSSYARRSSSSKPSGAANAAAFASSTTTSAISVSQPPSRSEANAFSASPLP